MALLDKLFKREKYITVAQIIDLLNMGRGLNVSINGKSLYNIPEVRTAINSVAETVGRVPFYHIRADNAGNIDRQFNRMDYVLTIRTNPYMSASVFLTYMATRVLLTNNAFAFPEWDDSGKIKWIFPLPYDNYQMSRGSDNRLYITFNGTHTFPYEDIIHFQRFPTDRGGSMGQATGNYVNIVNTLQDQAVKDSETSGRIAAILKTKIPLNKADMSKKLADFKDMFLNAENNTGFGMIDNQYDIEKVDLKTNPLNPDLMKVITKSLYNYFGTSEEIINGTATEIQYEQYVDKLKNLILQIQQELTYKLFTDTEIGHGNRIQAELIDLEISSLAAKTMFYKEAIFGGYATRNEIRQRIGLSRGDDKLDVFLESKNFQELGGGSNGADTGTVAAG